MAKTTNHPPYEIDPWKADTTEPPSGLTFNPEIVETAGKPKQAPVPPEPTEGQLKIEESISRVDKFNNEMNALREKQEKVLAEVEKNIDETDKKIKQLNELEEQIKQKVEEYTDETDGYLRQSELLKGELQESKAKMEKAVNDASSAITAAENAQKALEAYKNGEKARLEEAIKEAQSGVAKASEVNKQISSLKDSLGGEIDKQISANKAIKDIQSDNKALGSRLDDVLKASKQGVDDAAKAVELLNSNIDIGGSLIALVPGTSTPIWAERIDESQEITPDGEKVYVANEVGYQIANEKLVKASDKIEYLVSFWHKSSVPGSKMFIQLSSYDENGDRYNAVDYRKDKKEKDDGSVYWSKNSNQIYVIQDLEGGVEWTKHEYVIGLKPGTEFVHLKGLWWNHSSASATAAQYLGGFRIDPLIPSQADVDRAQNEAIGANTKAIEANTKAVKAQDDINKQNKEFQSLQKEFNTSQTKLNKTYDAMWDAQGKRNLLQEGIDKSQNQAVVASARASLAPSLGNSLVPYYSPSDKEILDGKAIWDIPDYARDKGDGGAGWIVSSEKPVNGKPEEVSNIGWAIGTKSGDGTVSYQGPDTPCVPGGTYNVEFWGYANSPDSIIYIEIRETKTGEHAVESGTGDSSGRRYIVGGMKFKVGWHKYTGTITLREGVQSVYISKWYWNHPAGEKATTQLITGLKIDLAVPSVWDVLKNQQDINDKQKEITEAHTKAIDSNRKAIRALAKIDLGGSLLAYMPLTDDEIKKGLTREYLPAWAANASNVSNGSDTSRGYSFLGSRGGSAKGEEVYAQVSQGTQYLLDIDLSAPTYLAFNIVFKTSNSRIKNPIKKFYWTDNNKYGGLKTTSYLTDTNKVTISTNGGRVPILVEFQDDVEDICVERLEWTYSNSVRVKRFTLAPYTPSQAAIDAQQDEALKGLKLAQDLQRDMTKQQQDFTTKLYDMSAGVIHLLRDEVAGSITHEIGFVMPSTDRLFKIYARTSFRGNLTILVNYATGVGDGLKTHRVKDTNLVTMSNPRNISSSIIKNSIFEDMPYSYRFGEVKVDIGDVESIVVLIDHINWKQG